MLKEEVDGDDWGRIRKSFEDTLVEKIISDGVVDDWGRIEKVVHCEIQQH